MVLTYICPGLGHFYAGKRKKGILLVCVRIVGLFIVVMGLLGLLSQAGHITPLEEVQMNAEGIVIEEESQPTEEASPSPFLPITLSVVGLGILTWSGIYGVKDARRI